MTAPTVDLSRCCVHCDRTVSTKDGKYRLHSVIPKTGQRCPLSYERIPPSGTTPDDYETRARIIADLAAQVQDGDPALAWVYLTCLPAVELQRMLQLSLAAIPVDQTVNEIWGWVAELPIARTRVTA